MATLAEIVATRAYPVTASAMKDVLTHLLAPFLKRCALALRAPVNTYVNQSTPPPSNVREWDG